VSMFGRVPQAVGHVQSASQPDAERRTSSVRVTDRHITSNRISNISAHTRTSCGRVQTHFHFISLFVKYKCLQGCYEIKAMKSHQYKSNVKISALTRLCRICVYETFDLIPVAAERPLCICSHIVL
jgi:hypothetical protein